MMFEVPQSQTNLMDEYKNLIVRKINDEYKGSRLFVTEKEILKAIPPLSRKELIEMMEESELPVFCDDYFSDVDSEIFKDFIESRIGEDFAVLKGLEGQVFCLHTVEDYVSKYLFQEKEDKPTNLVRINDKNKAA